MIILPYRTDNSRRHRAFKLKYWGVAAISWWGLFFGFVMAVFFMDNNKEISHVGAPARAAILELSGEERHYLGGSEIEFKEQDGTQLAVSEVKLCMIKTSRRRKRTWKGGSTCF